MRGLQRGAGRSVGVTRCEQDTAMGGNVARTVYNTHVKELEQRAQLEDFRLRGRLKLVGDGGLKLVGDVGLKLVGDGGFHVADSGFCEEGDEIPCYVKCGDSLD